jgi:hypothetical protein
MSGTRGGSLSRGLLISTGVAALSLLACQPAQPPAAPRVLSFERDPKLLIAEVERLRGVADSKPTRILFDDEPAFASAVRGKIQNDAIGPTDADSPAFALAFEFPPPTARQGSSWDEVYDEQLLGFYDEHSHAVHVRRALLGEKSELEVAAVVAHEITHSLQMQHFAVPDLRALTGEDQRLAQNAVLEGDAMLVMVAYIAQQNRIPLNRALVRAASAATEPEFDRYNRARGGEKALAGAPPLIRERLSFPYLHGMAFVGALYRTGGLELVNQVYTKPPLSTEQVLHPQKYVSGEAPVPVRAPEPPTGYQTLVSGSVGELQIRVILGYCLATERSATAAAGWGGDAYAVAAREKEGALLWSTVWDDEREAAEFEAALREYVACTRRRSGTHVMPEHDVVRREGKRVALLRGVPAQHSAVLLKELLQLPGVAPRTEPPFGKLVIRQPRQAGAYRPAYLSAGHYVNEQLGVVTRVPPHFAAELGGPTSATFSRKEASPVVMGIELSEQIASMQTVDEVHAALAGEFRRVLGNVSLEYVRGRDVQLANLGAGVEREWRVVGSSGGLKAIVLPVCAGTGSLVLWAVWADPSGVATVDWWLGSLRSTNAAEPPICAELNP